MPTVPRQTRRSAASHPARSVRRPAPARGAPTGLNHPGLVVDVAEPDAVVAFCERFGLTGAFRLALDGVARHLSPASPVHVSVKRDPEFPDEWVELDVAAAGRPGRVSAAYDRMTAEWLAAAPREAWSRVRVRLGLR